jgi:hypothetical protein
MGDPLLRDAVRRQPDREFDSLGFEELVNFGTGEGGVSPEIDWRRRYGIRALSIGLAVTVALALLLSL